MFEKFYLLIKALNYLEKKHFFFSLNGYFWTIGYQQASNLRIRVYNQGEK